MDLLGIDPSFFDYRLAQLDPSIVALLPFTVRLTYKGNKFQFVETSALGINVTTPFGPRSNMPVLKQDVLGMLAHPCIYMDMHSLTSYESTKITSPYAQTCQLDLFSIHYTAEHTVTVSIFVFASANPKQVR
jgi:hypothetical protein